VAMAPFTILGVVAIVAGGTVAARISSHPAPVLVWMVAYLVLVVGVAQYALGLGQARLAARPPSRALVAAEWGAFNLGNAGVIVGTVVGGKTWVLVGSVLVIVTMLAFSLRVRAGSGRPWWLAGYHALAALILVSAIVGIGLSLG